MSIKIIRIFVLPLIEFKILPPLLNTAHGKLEMLWFSVIFHYKNISAYYETLCECQHCLPLTTAPVTGIGHRPAWTSRRVLYVFLVQHDSCIIYTVFFYFWIFCVPSQSENRCLRLRIQRPREDGGNDVVLVIFFPILTYARLLLFYVLFWIFWIRRKTDVWRHFHYHNIGPNDVARKCWRFQRENSSSTPGFCAPLAARQHANGTCVGNP